jgi:protein disulfide-isomerase
MLYFFSFNMFIKNLDKTSKGNFGGGNTDWEDRKLGDYLYSETRFEEILENICDTSEVMLN